MKKKPEEQTTETEILKKTPLWEDIAVIAAIFAMWPTILFPENVYSKILMALALFAMAWILVRRLKRVRRL